MSGHALQLSDIAEVFNGKTPPTSEKRDSGHPVLKIRDIDSRGRFKGEFESFVDDSFAARYSSKTIKQGDTLILNAAHNAGYVGSKQFYAGNDVEGALATGEWLIVRAKKRKAASNYLTHWLSSTSTRFVMSRQVKGIHIYPRDVARLPISPPSMNEQQRIAAILDKADGIRRKRMQAIELADEFLRSVFLDMFGDPVLNTKGLPTERMSELGKLARGKSRHRPRNDPTLLGGPYPLIQTGDVAAADNYIRNYSQTYSELGLRQSRMWPRGVLCITIAANIADTAILDFDACFPDSVVGFVPNKKVRTAYIHVWLTFYQKILRDKAPESAQKNINLEILSNLEIPVPDLKDQEKFVANFLKVENLKQHFRNASKFTNELFEALSQRAFAGEL